MDVEIIYSAERAERVGRKPFRQPFVHPSDLLTNLDSAAPIFWSCVRTRPRWEKKFSRWLGSAGWNYFMPVLGRSTESGRKRRVTHVPVFPGYVFVAGRHGKGDFDRTGMVAYVLHPEGPSQVAQLHAELTGVWHGLNSGYYVEPVQGLSGGEPCVIVRGPLEGQSARFERPGRQGRLILQVELMGGGLLVEVPAGDIAVRPH